MNADEYGKARADIEQRFAEDWAKIDGQYSTGQQLLGRCRDLQVNALTDSHRAQIEVLDRQYLAESAGQASAAQAAPAAPAAPEGPAAIPPTPGNPPAGGTT